MIDYDFSGLLDPIKDLDLTDQEFLLFDEPTRELVLSCGCGTGLAVAGEYHADYCDVRKAAMRAKARNP